MTVLRSGEVRVSVPATSANLGPGFDALGLALDHRDEVTVEVLDLPVGSRPRIEVTGMGAGQVPLDESHLVHRSLAATFAVLEQPLPVVRLVCRNRIPHARGLGSSSAAIVAGVCAARALLSDGLERLSDEAALDLAADLEGHPDNVAPALLGGLTVAYDDGSTRAASLEVASDLRVVALVPPSGVSTERARGLLPASVPHPDAAANAGRAALLVAAMTGRTDLLLPATEDRLHQEFRRPAMPESLALVDRLRADGAAALVSGAGPTVLVLAGGEAAGREVGRVAASAPDGWTVLQPRVDVWGARVEEPAERR